MKVDAHEDSVALRSTLAEINVIPLVDIVLVLLLIFMLTAPMMYRGIDVNLPRTGQGSHPTEISEKIVLSVDENQKVFLQDKPVSLSKLSVVLRTLYEDRKDKSLYIKADRSTPYGFIVEMMDAIRQAGIEKIGMISRSKDPS